MADIPDNEPAEIVAGDTVQWTRSFADYKASAGWALSYALINTAGKIEIAAATSGDDFAVTIAAGTSDDYDPGTYSWQAYVTKAAERFTVDAGTIIVRPNFADETNLDSRSHVKKVLDAINAVIEGRATKDQEAYTIGSRSLKRTPISELLALRDKYRAEYQAELDAERIANGLGTNKRLMTRFNR